MDGFGLQELWTLFAFVFFMGVVIWVLSPKRKSSFEKAANLPLEDELNPTQSESKPNADESSAKRSTK